MIADPGSFRDPGGTVMRDGERILRIVRSSAAEDYRAFQASGLLERLVQEKRLVPSIELNEPLREELGGELLLEHPALPFISYPYEWGFTLLRRAALHHLEVQIDALKAGFALSDATAYNVQFDGARPVFIDHLSFTRYREGEPWAGHRQFCMQFLNPLILWSRFGVPPNAWFRGSLEGIAPEEMAPLLKLRHKLSWTVFSHVTLQASIQRKLAGSVTGAERANATKLRQSGYEAILLGLKHFVHSCRLPKQATTWADYATHNSYAAEQAEAKKMFVMRAVESQRPALLVDLGCNSGDYSLAALDAGAERVIGFDFDHGALEAASARTDLATRAFLPLWLDAANPSPSQGWAEAERRGLSARFANADSMVALAFIHHLAIGRNIPLSMAVDWLMSVAPRGVIEFPNKSDPMVQLLLSQRRDIFPSYNEENFLAEVSKRGRIVEQEHVSDRRRLLVHYDRTS
ncbi:MAG: class I SAM-dependent methyltransferase [Sphingomonadales bacterium]|nr:MAG: class I SAM-dependent methyltransferase [Sphingomonadales bacterium]